MEFTSASEALAVVNNGIQLIQNGIGLTKTRRASTGLTKDRGSLAI